MPKLTEEQANRLHESCTSILSYTIMTNRLSLERSYDRLGAMMDAANILGHWDGWELIKTYKDKIGAAIDAVYATAETHGTPTPTTPTDPQGQPRESRGQG